MSSSNEEGVAVPSNEMLRIETDRLILEPVFKEHAQEMVDVLSSPELYHFIPQEPPTLSELEVRYEKWESRCSPDKKELWLNWVARKKTDNRLVGHFQAGFQLDRTSSVAYTVGKQFQRQGFALEALMAVVRWLRKELKVSVSKAWVDTRNEGSIRLLERLEFKKTAVLPAADFFKGQSSDEFIFLLNQDLENDI